jgi:hypothetical protein
MGLFKKLKDSVSDIGTPPSADQVSAQQRAMGIDTADFGGPSNAPVADDDPIFAPIDGIDLATYARLAKKGQAAGVTDEAGMAAIAEAEGIDPATWSTASKGWIDRMGQNMAVGQKFRQHLDAS